MTYQLDREEIDQVREIIHILITAYNGPGIISTDQEDKLFRIAIELNRKIQ